MLIRVEWKTETFFITHILVETFSAEKSYGTLQRVLETFFIRELIFRSSHLLFHIAPAKLKYLENFSLPPELSKNPSRQKDREELKFKFELNTPQIPLFMTQSFGSAKILMSHIILSTFSTQLSPHFHFGANEIQE